MAQKTNIEWSQHVWNFLRGCRRVSDGCKNCYAEQIAGRFSGTDKNGKELPYFGLATKNGEARWTGKVSFHEDILLEPLKRKKPTTYFVNSMSDLFYEEVKDEWIDKAFAVMALTPQHTYQILTKRPERMKAYFDDPFRNLKIVGQIFYVLSKQFIPCEAFQEWSNLCGSTLREIESEEAFYLAEYPLPNVWLGVSAENQKTADERIPLLLETPAAVRFLSCEPLLEEIDLKKYLSDFGCSHCQKIDWVIVGGESGQNVRPFHLEHGLNIIRQCQSAGVKTFFKQAGSNPFYHDQPLKLKSRKGSDLSELLSEFKIRQMPEQAVGAL